MAVSPESIERTLLEEYNIAVGPFPRGNGPIYPLFSVESIKAQRVIDLIADWLKALGVDPDKANSMSPSGRQNAYSAGRTWVYRNLLGAPEFTPGRRYRQAKPGGIKLGEGFAPGELGGLLGEKPIDKDLYDPDDPLDNPPVDTPKMVPQVDTGAIERAADLVIGKRIEAGLNRFRQENQRAIVDAVETEVAKLGAKVSEETRAKIADIATAAAQAAAKAYINEMVPRRLEIITPKGRKMLDAEPRHSAFDRILFWLSLKRHVYIVGPHGTGKTHLFKQLSEALDLKYFPIGQTLTKYELSGYKGPTGEYIGTHLRDAIENGGFCGIDEGDTWAAAAMVFLNTPLANGYCSFPDKVVPVHKDFVCCIAANTWGHGATMQYQGRNPLDAASLDRFAFEEVDYDEKLEIQLYGDTPWTQYCQRVRKVCRELKIYEAAPSMRGTEMGNLALAAGGDPEMVQKSVLWKGLALDTVSKIKAQAGTFGRQIREVA